jgi:hypothetical protein
MPTHISAHKFPKGVTNFTTKKKKGENLAGPERGLEIKITATELHCVQWAPSGHQPCDFMHAFKLPKALCGRVHSAPPRKIHSEKRAAVNVSELEGPLLGSPFWRKKFVTEDTFRGFFGLVGSGRFH